MNRMISSLMGAGCLFLVGLMPAWAGDGAKLLSSGGGLSASRAAPFGGGVPVMAKQEVADDEQDPVPVPLPRPFPAPGPSRSGAGQPAPEPIPFPGPTDASTPAKRLVKEAKTLKANKEFDKAIKVLLAALVIDDECVPAMTELAWLLNEKKEYDDAIKVAKVALRLEPRNAEVWRELGYSHMKNVDYDEAIMAFGLAIDLNPKDWSTYDYLAEAFRKTNQPDLARAVLKVKAERKAKEDEAPKPKPVATPGRVA